MSTPARGAYSRRGAADPDAAIFAATLEFIRAIPSGPVDLLSPTPVGEGVDWAALGVDVLPDWVDAANPSLATLREIEPPPPRRWRHLARPSQIPPPGYDWLYWVIMAGRGFGKCLDANTPVPVLYDTAMISESARLPGPGWKRMGDLIQGDQVFDESGRPCRVTATYDRTPTTAYRLTFSDGATIDACGEHQWVTWTHADRKAYLRSQHEPDVTRFPDEWPSWRPMRLPPVWLERGPVDKALALVAEGWSTRRAAEHVNACRQALAPHVAAGRYLPRTPSRSRSPRALGPRIRTTQEIVDTLTYGGRGDTNHCVPTCGPLQLPECHDFPIDPWLLGYWLGNGTTTAAHLTSHYADTDEVTQRIRSVGYEPTIRPLPDRGQTSFSIPGGFRHALMAGGLLGNKHVPNRYLWGSIDQREALLRGLMDSDGYCDPESGQVEFCSTSRELADAVVHLARSLGQKPVLGEGRAMLNGVDHGPKYRVTWRPTRNPFTLSRKSAMVRPDGAQSLRNHHRMIVSAERIDPAPMRCITVDSPHSMYLAGEAMIPTHNTWTGANVLIEWATATRGDYAVIAPTFGDARKIATEGPSGLIKALGDDLRTYNKSDYVLYLRNGSRIVLASADAPDRLRGYNLSGAWCDEMASFGNAQKDLWDNALLPALRIGRHPRMVITTTPRRSAIVLRELLGRAERGDPAVVITRGSTFENVANLSPAFLREMETRYAGTTTGRQELEGEMLDEVEGALVTAALINSTRIIDGSLVPSLRRLVIGVDPAVTINDTSDACGLIAVGLGGPPLRGYLGAKSLVEGPHLYFLGDATMRGSPRAWALRAIEMAEDWEADAMIVEVNQGGDLCTTMLRMVAKENNSHLPRLTPVHASHGKRTRAEPVAGVFEQCRAHIVGGMPGLEDGFTSWCPGDAESPNELDAAVWAAVGLIPSLGVKARPPVRVIAS